MSNNKIFHSAGTVPICVEFLSCSGGVIHKSAVHCATHRMGEPDDVLKPTIPQRKLQKLPGCPDKTYQKTSTHGTNQRVAASEASSMLDCSFPTMGAPFKYFLINSPTRMEHEHIGIL
jgi:hypothetical protein